jgi:hypothetical protein
MDIQPLDIDGIFAGLPFTRHTKYQNTYRRKIKKSITIHSGHYV